MDFDTVHWTENLLNPFAILKLYNFDPKMTMATTCSKNYCYKGDTEEERRRKISLIDNFQTEVDYLLYEWNSIHIVLESIRNAYTIKNITPEYLDEVEKELSASYDELKAQVRHLERRLKKVSIQINQQLR